MIIEPSGMTIRISMFEQCERCQGYGIDYGSGCEIKHKGVTCGACHGTGKVLSELGQEALEVLKWQKQQEESAGK